MLTGRARLSGIVCGFTKRGAGAGGAGVEAVEGFSKFANFAKGRGWLWIKVPGWPFLFQLSDEITGRGSQPSNKSCCLGACFFLNGAFTTTVVVALVSPEYAYSVSVLLAPDVSFAILTISQPVPELVAFPTPTTRSVVVLPVSLAG